MASANQPSDHEEIVDAIVDEESKGLPIVWLLPLVALLVGGWLFYKTMSEKGPEIQIEFETAEGIEEGKTTIKFRNVTVGKIEDVGFSEDLRSVVLTATLESGTEPYLTENSRFWVVKPRIGAGGVSGLGTVFSGAYIAFEPHTDGKKQRTFVGLERPPIVPIDKAGTKYRLQARTLGSLSIGAPVYFREFDIGEVTDYTLADNYRYVDIGIFVEAPYDRYVREGTRFWNAGGISVAMDASGVKMEMESLVAVLSGGIAFDTSPEMLDTPVAKKDHVFTLYKNRAESLEEPITEVITYALNFKGTVRGLKIGAPVEYRGIRLGTVKDIMWGADPEHAGVASPVVIIDIEPQRTLSYRDLDAAAKSELELEQDPRARIEALVERGLRARLQTGSLVTGALFVDFDIYPEAEPAKVTHGGLYPELPTVPTSLQSLVANINQILNKLEQADLQSTLTNVNKLVMSTNKLVSTTNQLVSTLDRNAPDLVKEAHATLRSADRTLRTLESTASSDGEIGNQLNDALREIAAAARSIRVMAEYLERHPEAMLKGKGGNR